MQLTSQSLSDGHPIAGEFAFCVPAAEGHVALSSNRNPHLSWRDAPAGTRSFAVICHDPDVPSRGDDVNQADREVPADLPRVDFFHWVMLDLPPTLSAIAAGEFSKGFTVRGKAGPATLHGARHGLNDYTGWFAGDRDMNGDYCGYDGPFPPFNDSILHHYVFTLYALDVERLPVQGLFTGPQVREAMAGHVVGQASITGTYTLNPRLGA